MTSLSESATDVLLALADDELFVGHRHSQWLCVAPLLEEDLAFVSIGQDELGHATAIYSLVVDGDGSEVDRLAFDRDHSAYRSSWLAEARCADWEDALVRHVLYDLAEEQRWRAMSDSRVPGLAAVAAKALAEEAYHRAHALMVFERMAGSTAEARVKLVDALTRLLPLAVDAFEATTGEAEALAGGVLSMSSAEMRGNWQTTVIEVLAAADLGEVTMPEPSEVPGGRSGVRSEVFGAMIDDMTMVRSIDPAATW